MFYVQYPGRRFWWWPNPKAHPSPAPHASAAPAASPAPVVSPLSFTIVNR